MKTITITSFLAIIAAGMIAMPTAVFAQSNTSSLQVDMRVRNLTQEKFAWQEVVQAAPGDRIEFQIVVENATSEPADNTTIRVSLPERLEFEGNTKLQGSSKSGNPAAANMLIGSIPAQGSKTLTFEVLVDTASNFSKANTNLISTVTAFNTSAAASDSTTIQVFKGGIPTSVSTGMIDPFWLAIIISIVTVFLASYALLLKYYISNHIVQSAYNTRTERKLATMINRVREKEGFRSKE